MKTMDSSAASVIISVSRFILVSSVAECVFKYCTVGSLVSTFSAYVFHAGSACAARRGGGSAFCGLVAKACLCLLKSMMKAMGLWSVGLLQYSCVSHVMDLASCGVHSTKSLRLARGSPDGVVY